MKTPTEYIILAVPFYADATIRPPATFSPSDAEKEFILWGGRATSRRGGQSRL
jgi:hypothetical protein